MKRFLFVLSLFLVLSLTAFAQTSGTLTAHYDVPRQVVLFSLNYSQQLTPSVALQGYIEYWKHNNPLAYPLNQPDFFSKTWAQWSITSTLAVSMELEWSYNNMSAYYKNTPFEPKKLYVMPKIGLAVKLW
jgi:hypothetical protein